MNKRPPSLFRTWPFWMLCLSAIGAVVLYTMRGQYFEQPWFPFAIGATAAMALIPLKFWSINIVQTPSKSGWSHIIFFGISSLLGGAAAYFLIFVAREYKLGFSLGVCAAFFAYASLGTLYDWPGYRRPLEPGQCRGCRYDLTGNTSGVCPECGQPID